MNFPLPCCPFALLSVHLIALASLCFLVFPIRYSSLSMIVSYTCVLLCISWSQTSMSFCYLSASTLCSIAVIFRFYISSRTFEVYLTLRVYSLSFYALTLLHNLYLLLSLVWISSLTFSQYPQLFFSIALNPLLCWFRSCEFLLFWFLGYFRD